MTQGTIGPASSLGDRYQLIEVIGTGGMATVWRAFDGRLRRVVAVKVISERLAEDIDFQRRFEREARHIASLSHPGIVAVHDFGVDRGRAFIVMEYVEGRSLRQILKESGAISVPETAALAVDVLPALQHAHDRGIVHRDIKPGNILVSPDGVAKVADFGVATVGGDTTDITLPGSLVGTAVYASPEQLADEQVGPTSDLYSLGCVLYECLAGKPPFGGGELARVVLQQRFADPNPIESVRDDIPDVMASAIMRALEKSPIRRFASARAMKEAFNPALGLTNGGTAVLRRPSGHGESAGDLTGVLTVTGSRVEIGSKKTALISSSPDEDPASGSGNGHGGPPRSLRRRWRRVVLALIVAVLAVGATVAGFAITSGPNPASSPRVGSDGEMPPGDLLQSGTSLLSPNGRFGLAMHTGGNLTTYVVAGTIPTWESGTGGSPGAYAAMQSDGNFVVYPADMSAPAEGQPTSALWFSGTSGSAGASLWLLNDGNLEIRSHGTGRVLWQTGAVPGSVGSELLPGEELHADQYLQSPNRRYRLLNDPATGVLKLFRITGGSCLLWEQPRVGHPVSYAVMQPSGNFVLYQPRPLSIEWQTSTGGNPSSSLVLEDTGALVLSSASGITLWQASLRPSDATGSRCIGDVKTTSVPAATPAKLLRLRAEQGTPSLPVAGTPPFDQDTDSK